MFENRVLREIFGPKRDEVTGEWRKFHYEELQNLYSSKSIIHREQIEKNKWAAHVARMEERRGAYGVLLGNPDGKSTHGKSKLKWENIKMYTYLKEIVWEGVELD